MNIPFPNKGAPGGRRKPLPICYICGRQYSTASLPIHEPQCLKKWKNENDKLPKSMRRPEPVKPQPMPNDKGLKASGKYNYEDANWQAAQANLVPCSGCGRTFSQDRIQKHQSICVRTGIVPGVAQTKPNLDPNCEFAKRMSYKPVHPTSKMINYKGIGSTLGLRKRQMAAARSSKTAQRDKRRHVKEITSPRVVATPQDTPRRKDSKKKPVDTPMESARRVSSNKAAKNSEQLKTTSKNLEKSVKLAKFCTGCGAKFQDREKFCRECAEPRRATG